MPKQQDRASQVVEKFKQRLNPAVQGTISDNELAALAELIRGAIIEEQNISADLVEEVARKIRAANPKPEIGL